MNLWLSTAFNPELAQRVNQTTFFSQSDGDGGGTPGNSLRACVASVLGVDRDDMPRFEEQDKPWTSLIKWAMEHEVSACQFVFNHEMRTDGPFRDIVPEKYPLIAKGLSPREDESWHYVVWKGGKVIHDPHPDGEGINGRPFAFFMLYPFSKGVRRVAVS